jgi:acetyl-CoA carboxylase carboxyltransferase component
MCGKGLKPDLIVGWPTAEISLMGAEGAVNIMMKNETGSDAQTQKAEKVKEYKTYIGGLISARLAHIDDLIDPRETRQVLMRALQFCFNKKAIKPRKKQGVMPV